MFWLEGKQVKQTKKLAPARYAGGDEFYAMGVSRQDRHRRDQSMACRHHSSMSGWPRSGLHWIRHRPWLMLLCAGVLLAKQLHAQQLPPAAVTAPSPEPTIVPPQAQYSPPAIYPQLALKAGREATVELFVSIDEKGMVGDVEVARSGGEDFDAAAVDTVKTWRFTPAMRGSTPMASRIRIPFRFSQPKASPLPPKPKPTPSLVRQPKRSTSDASAEDKAIEVTVVGERGSRSRDRGASTFQIDREIIEAAPREEGAEVLRSAPGLYIGRPAGSAVAHSYMLRGFDADHGQDIEFRVGGLPINLPSHIHGQGYADLSFLIGDVIQALDVSEGVYDPRQGDFAVAGSIHIALGVEERDRGIRLRSSYGAFNRFQQLMLWAPKKESRETFAAVKYMRTDGFGQNRAGQSGSGIIQHRFGSGSLRFRIIGIAHAARSDLAGVLRKDDIDQQRVCYYCVYPHASAQAQNALAQRFLAGFFADYQHSRGSEGQFGAWLGYDNFRIQRNFTGFIQRSRSLENTSGRGDLIEQQNQTLSFGLTGRYRTAPYQFTKWARGTIELGTDGRLDIIDQAQNLIDAAVRQQTWDRRVDAAVRAFDVALWGDLDWQLTRFVRARFGIRTDILSYEANDRLGNFVPLTRPQDSFIVGFRRSAFGLAWGPRASVRVRPLSWLSILAAYGEGYRSPQARSLEDGERAPFSKVRSTDLGLRFDWKKRLSLTTAGYYTHLSDDVAFDAAEGRLERIGATQRFGMVAYAMARPLSWLVASLSFTWVRAELLEPPPSTAEEPDPPFTKGQSLPFVPRLSFGPMLGCGIR